MFHVLIKNLDFSGANSPSPSVSSEDTCSIYDAPSANQEDHLGLGESNDWRRLFKTNNSLGKLNFVAPRKVGDKLWFLCHYRMLRMGLRLGKPVWLGNSLINLSLFTL